MKTIKIGQIYKSLHRLTFFNKNDALIVLKYSYKLSERNIPKAPTATDNVLLVYNLTQKRYGEINEAWIY